MLKQVALVLAAMMAFTSPAAAQTNCMKRENALKQLAMGFNETRIAVGVADNGGLVEVLSSRNGQTWTILMTLPNGISCLMAAGENWESVKAIAMGSGI